MREVEQRLWDANGAVGWFFDASDHMYMAYFSSFTVVVTTCAIDILHFLGEFL